MPVEVPELKPVFFYIMIDLVIIVYNRYDNIIHWLHCLSLCDTINVRVTVIHNGDETYNLPQHINYIKRKNIGYDIGAFQDVCRNRLKGFPKDWTRLLWCTDDTFPMCRDFIRKFEAINDEVVCMKISPYVRQHIRTTGFMITREAAERLIFPADPVKTKDDCYRFEHRATKGTFLTQVSCKQVAPDESSPMWDVGYHRKLNRAKEHAAIFGDYPLPEVIEQKEKTTIICPIYKSFPAVISSLIMQQNPNWELWLIHDGPSDGAVESYLYALNDDRIKYFETKEHSGNWGHSIRAEWLQKVETKYLMVSNPDNYYAPTFLNKAISAFTHKGTTVATYCSQMVHSYKDWQVINCMLKRGYIDCGGVLLKTKEAQEVGWRNITDHSADWLFFNDIAARYGSNKFVSFSGCLFIHN